MASSTIEFGALVTGLGGGLALFLFGMRQMTESLKTVAGNSMKNLLARLTANRFTAACKRRRETVALGGWWRAVELCSAQMFTC